MFRLVAMLWWLGLLVQLGIAFFIMVAGSTGSVAAAVLWIGWGTLVVHYLCARESWVGGSTESV
jgi:hypothetical protein